MVGMTKESTPTAQPCEIKEKYGSKSAHIEFDENAAASTFLFAVPFEGDFESELESITFTSNELAQATLDEYFELNKKSLVLRKPYDLNAIESDFVELVFTCTSKPTRMSGGERLTNTFPLYITVNDVNDKAPEFIGQPYKFSIKEVPCYKKKTHFNILLNLSIYK